MENDYGKIFAEVLDIINNSEKEVKAKIPEKLYQQFEKNTDKSYKVNIDYSREDWDNNISEETKEILALIYRDYIVSPEERKELIKEETELEKQKDTKFEINPKISIIIPMYNTPEKFFKELVDGLIEQTYPNWELCLADGSPEKNEKLEKEIITMEKLIEILEDIQPDADYETCTTLIDDGILDSFAILSIVGELEDEFDVSVTPADIIPENFNSAQALWAMVQRLQAE